MKEHSATFDTLAATRALEACGLSCAQAEAAIETVHQRIELERLSALAHEARHRTETHRQGSGIRSPPTDGQEVSSAQDATHRRKEDCSYRRSWPPLVRDAAALLLTAQAEAARTLQAADAARHGGVGTDGHSLDDCLAAVDRAAELLVTDPAFRGVAREAQVPPTHLPWPACIELTTAIEAAGGYVAIWRVRCDGMITLHRNRAEALNEVAYKGGEPERLPWPVEVADGTGSRRCDRCPGWLHDVVAEGGAGPLLLCVRCLLEVDE